MLKADCLLDDGIAVRTSSIDLSTFIGVDLINAKLVWGGSNFQNHCQDIRIEDNHLLVVTIKESVVKLDLNLGLRNVNGMIVYTLATGSAQFSEWISTMPWVQFQIAARPDFSGFIRSPIANMAMETVATSVVDSVVAKMTKMINVAIQEAIEEVKVKAKEEVKLVVESMLAGSLAVHGEAVATATAKMKLMAQLAASGGILTSGAFAAAAGGGYGVSGGLQGSASMETSFESMGISGASGHAESHHRVGGHGHHHHIDHLGQPIVV